MKILILINLVLASILVGLLSSCQLAAPDPIDQAIEAQCAKEVVEDVTP